MSFPTPGWHTDELAEEWPESSPSPPVLPVELPPIPKATINMDSIRAKRGSLRMLGQASARPLPPSRSASSGSQPGRIVSGHVDNGQGHVPRSRSLSHKESGLLSPPSSRSSSGAGQENVPESVAGTFVVKEGVEDNRGQHLARNPMGAKGGKDIFGALPLERMFDPPSPPTNPTAEQQQSPPSAFEPIAESSTAISTPTPAAPNHTRRPSHPYAPANPSRLSKSVTPSTNDSFATNSSASGSLGRSHIIEHELELEEADSLIRDDTLLREDGDDSLIPGEGEFYTAPQGQDGTTKSRLGEITLKSGEVETDLSPFNRRGSGDYPFTFNAPRHPSGNISTEQGHSERSIFDPDNYANGEEGPSHSTLNMKPKSRPALEQVQPLSRGVSQQSSNPGLRLFRSTYDTYTREHLSALVDSIAIEPSPSPPNAQSRQASRDWSPAADSASPSASGSRSTPSSSNVSSDARSSKRLRLSPASPPKRYSGLRDWGAQGRAMMEKIRGRDTADETTTSASKSQTTNSDAHEYEMDGPTVDYEALPPTPPLDQAPPRQTTDKPTHRSNPSTTSSGYLRAAEDIMARIKSRKVSESASGVENSPVAIGGRRILSESDENRMWEEGAEDYAKSRSKAKSRTGPSPRRMLRRLSASEEIKRVAEEDSGSSDERSQPLRNSLTRPRQQLEERRPTSRASTSSNPGGPSQPAQAPFNADDLNRYMSSSTHATSTVVSTSFVKHRGPKAVSSGPAHGMRMIRPDDVQGVVPDRIGKMRFDRAGMRWVREELGPVDEAGESRLGGSEESVDVFAGMESLPDDTQRNNTNTHSVHQAEISVFSVSSASISDNGDVIIHEAERTRIIDEEESDIISESEAEEEVEEPTEVPSVRPSAPSPASIDPESPHRPMIHHASTAPAIMTPTPSAYAPKPIRSALRNALTPAGVFKKRTGWSDEVTPAGTRGATPGSSGKRSVSFSDGKKTGKIVGLEVEIKTTAAARWSTTDENDLFNEDSSSHNTGENSKSFLPSARTKRIQNLLEDMEEMSLEDETPSKPSRAIENRPASRASSAHSSDSESTVPIRSFRGRSFRAHTPRNPGDATFLTECSFGVAHDKLVELITDVHPFEAHWEDLKSINLKGKGADSVARLKEFLPALDEANLDDNAISYLSGIPSTVRNLHVAGNKLTSLTSVNHLRNLQYLDISRNQLDSVAQLECLKHLRDLKVDNNAVMDLSGIMNMDCLIKLSCANNQITSLDLSNAQWSKMETLNLANNKIKSVRDLHKLSSVASINLDGNQLDHLEPSRPMSSVRVLRLSENNIDHFDLSLFPKIRTLYADGNKLTHLSRSSSSGSGRLENLSLRNQRSNIPLKLVYRDLENIKRLYLSGNSLSFDFFPPSSTPLYALVYLEIAACQLTIWPDFSKLLPNLKVLNMNYNYLRNLDGVKGLKGLRKLTLVGGRLGSEEVIGGSKGILEGLKGLDGLEEIDFRMNPSTLSYYFPLLLPSSPSTPQSALDPSSSISGKGIVGAPASTWQSYDSRFRKNLPDEWYSKRLVYRGLVMSTCPNLKRLDGIQIEEGERKKAEELLRAALRRRV
ncbi:hypothetical protein I302_104281 [Kwoniella bestiolae CBS 10118]|uniref:Leucine repeat containing protein n=1 Tax=Kwoniella bestiolae CBS 10118 TaxID=1296100 RepID=A0A1B9GAT7_9TREE|nr:hypothetical protein I302_02989 [Kwoniella bestiolae CBS 10118]OCF28138.1 hypothetical protein I302_02989 [Kwoniella bestiolae CBS 10118]